MQYPQAKKTAGTVRPLERGIHHRFCLGDDDRFAFEAAKPVALPTMIPFNIVRGRFIVYQLVLWNDRGIGCPLIRAIQPDVPLRKAIDHLLSRRLIPSPTFPVEQLPRVAIQCFPDPESLNLSDFVVD